MRPNSTRINRALPDHLICHLVHKVHLFEAVHQCHQAHPEVDGAITTDMIHEDRVEDQWAVHLADALMGHRVADHHQARDDLTALTSRFRCLLRRHHRLMFSNNSKCHQ